MNIWDKVKATFGRSNITITINTAKRTFEWHLAGITTKENAIDSLLSQYEKTNDLQIRNKIALYVKEIWRRP